jgi:hypothetical protein
MNTVDERGWGFMSRQGNIVKIAPYIGQLVIALALCRDISI